MMRANCKIQREGSRQKKKARSNSSEQGGSKRDKKDESKPTDSSKFQEQETRKKTPGARARKQDIRPSLPWCFSVARGSVLEAWAIILELASRASESDVRHDQLRRRHPFLVASESDVRHDQLRRCHPFLVASESDVGHDQLQAAGAIRPSLPCGVSMWRGGPFWKPGQSFWS